MTFMADRLPSSLLDQIHAALILGTWDTPGVREELLSFARTLVADSGEALPPDRVCWLTASVPLSLIEPEHLAAPWPKPLPEELWYRMRVNHTLDEILELRTPTRALASQVDFEAARTWVPADRPAHLRAPPLMGGVYYTPGPADDPDAHLYPDPEAMRARAEGPFYPDHPDPELSHRARQQALDWLMRTPHPSVLVPSQSLETCRVVTDLVAAYDDLRRYAAGRDRRAQNAIRNANQEAKEHNEEHAVWFGKLSAARAEVARLEAENDRLRQDRYDALSVTSRDGLLSSEWIARTGKAERERDEARAEVDRLRGELARREGDQ